MTDGFDYKIFHNEFDITEIYRGDIESIELTDNLGLQADQLDIEFNDTDFNYLEIFGKGDTISCVFWRKKGEELKTNTFYVDQIGGNLGSQNIHTVGCVSKPMDRQGFDQYVAYSKKKAPLKKILKDILEKGEIDLDYQFLKESLIPWEIIIKGCSHYDTTVGDVVNEYADTFGAIIKVHNDKLIFANKYLFKNLLKNNPADFSIDPKSDIIEDFSYEYNHIQYDHYEIRYYDPKTGKMIVEKRESKSKLKKDTVKSLRRLLRSVDKAKDETRDAISAAIKIGSDQSTVDKLRDEWVRLEKKSAAIKRQIAAVSKKKTLATKAENIKKINSKISSPEEAQAIAMSVDSQDIFTVEFSTDGHYKGVAGAIVDVKELYNFTGNYLIKSAKHSFSNRWEMSVTATNLF